MNTSQGYFGKNPPRGMELTKEELCKRVELLQDMVVAVINHLGKTQDKNLHFIQVATASGFQLIIHEIPRHKESPISHTSSE